MAPARDDVSGITRRLEAVRERPAPGQNPAFWFKGEAALVLSLAPHSGLKRNVAPACDIASGVARRREAPPTGARPGRVWRLGPTAKLP